MVNAAISVTATTPAAIFVSLALQLMGATYYETLVTIPAPTVLIGLKSCA